MAEHYTAADLEALRVWDTPTICNGLELIVPDRRAIGFAIEPMLAADRSLKHIVGIVPVSRRETVILDICASPDFTAAKLRGAVRQSGEIH